MPCLKFLTLHFSSDNTIRAAPSLFTPPSATINQEIIYGAILICVYLPYYDASSMTGSGQGHWVASSKSTAEATLLAPVFYHGTPQGLSVRLPRFRCVHPRVLPVFPHDKSPANAAGGSNISPRLAKEPDTGRPIGTIWEWLAAAARVRALRNPHPPSNPPPATQLKTPARCGDHSTHVMGFSV